MLQCRLLTVVIYTQVIDRARTLAPAAEAVVALAPALAAADAVKRSCEPAPVSVQF